MSVALLIGRLFMAGMFLVSGVAKFKDQAGTRKALQDFGLPRFLVSPFSILLPLAELIIAILLIPLSTAWWGALGAFGLLVSFTIAIAINLLRGKTPTCHCFGQLDNKPISWKTLVRNLVLLLIAAWLMWYSRVNPGFSILAWTYNLSLLEQIGVLSLVLNGVLFAGMGWIVLLLWQQQGRILKRLEAVEVTGSMPFAASLGGNGATIGLPIGSSAPDFTLPDLSGRSMTRDKLLTRGKPVLLLFVDPHCKPCDALLPKVSQWQQTIPSQLSIVIVSHGSVKENQAKKAEYNLDTVLLQNDFEIAQTYHVKGTPSAVLVQPDGRIGSLVAAGEEAIATLVAQVTRETEPTLAQIKAIEELEGQFSTRKAATSLTVGQPAPQLTLSNLDGQLINFEDYRGRKTVVIFWNPGCSFCVQMLPQLRTWEIFPPPNAPQILLVSVGTVETNRAMGLGATIVLDNELSLTRQFGVRGTPAGVLIDAEGRIASQVVAGVSAISKLMNTD